VLQFYKGSILFTAACLALGAWYGWEQSGTLAGTLSVLWIVIVLSVLEISLSFDNAVVNATVLKDMDAVWQRRFLTWGMVIAVFGMRIVFPLAIVAIAAGLGPTETVRLSLNDPVRYEAIVSSAHVGIAGFGGAFLAMVGLKFFFDSDKEVHWIGVVEEKLARFSRIEAVEIAFLLVALYLISRALPTSDALTFMIAGTMGLVTFIAVEAIGTILAEQQVEAVATDQGIVPAQTFEPIVTIVAGQDIGQRVSGQGIAESATDRILNHVSCVERKAKVRIDDLQAGKRQVHTDLI